MKNIKVNGQIRAVDENISVAEFLLQIGVNSEFVVVECDEKIVPKRDFISRKMDGSCYEIIEFVGGG